MSKRQARVLCLVLLTALAWIMPAFDVSAEAGPEVIPSAVVIVGGVRVPAVPGSFVAVGTRDAFGHCQGLDRVVEVRAPETIRYGSVELDVTADCRLRVVAVTFDRVAHLPPVRPADALTPSRVARADKVPLRQASPPVLSFRAAAVVTHEIWSDESFFEQFGVKVTEVYNRFRYMDDGSSVYNQTMWEAWCWHDPFGWTTDSCLWRDYSSPPSAINTNTYGTFHNECCGGINHSLQANGWAQPGGIWTYWCNFGGTAPPFWHDNCTGGRNF